MQTLISAETRTVLENIRWETFVETYTAVLEIEVQSVVDRRVLLYFER